MYVDARVYVYIAWVLKQAWQERNKFCTELCRDVYKGNSSKRQEKCFLRFHHTLFVNFCFVLLFFLLSNIAQSKFPDPLFFITSSHPFLNFPLKMFKRL